MGAHGPARDQDNEAGDEVALGSAIPILAQPHTGKTGTPPNYAHRSMLPVIVGPCVAPGVLGKGVDASPCGNDRAVEELLRASGPSEPNLAHDQKEGEDDTVGNEETAHDEVSQALSETVALTESKSRDATEQHLNPGEKGHGLAQDAVSHLDKWSNPAIDALLQV